MSAIDEAFIRAYQSEGPPPAAAPRPADSIPPDALESFTVGAEMELLDRGSAGAGAVTFFQMNSEELLEGPLSATTDSKPSVSAPGPSEESPDETLAERRPLSSFVQPAAPVEAVFRPGLEVDGFRWPEVCQDLTTHWAPHFSEVISELLAADSAGRSIVGVAGSAEGVGATTLTLCLARLLAKEDKTVAVVDGNFTDPQLAGRLSLAVDTGWEDVLSGETTLAESVVYSLADSIALLPLVGGGLRASEKLDSIHASVTAGVLRYHYDMVLVDLGSVAGGGQTPIARKIAQQLRIDAAVLAADQASAAATERLVRSAPELAEAMLGVIENQTTIAAAAG